MFAVSLRSRSVLADVFRGRLKPGQHLVTQDLAERFGVSHTPVREALIELAGVGVIDLLPNRGAIVFSGQSRELLDAPQRLDALMGVSGRTPR